jgi:DDE superfamily endonuclease
VNAHQDKIARSCDSTGESTPRPATTPRSIIRHAGPLARPCCRAPIEVHSGPCNSTAAAATALSVGIDDRRYCNRRTKESRSIHPSLVRFTLWNDRSALVGAGTLARPRCADPFQSSDLGPPDRVDFGVLQIVRKGQTHASSPWDPALVVKAVAERVVRAIDVQAWVLDDTGFPKDGKDSPGVKRQYSGTLGKTGNCQIGVSVHAVGRKGTVPLGWALYLPEEWCEDSERRRNAKIPDEVVFKTKPELGVELVERAAGWGIARAPILGDCAYGKNTELRERLDNAELEYVLSVLSVAATAARSSGSSAWTRRAP